MRFKNGYLLHKTNTNGSYLLASLHWRWSITWRWALWLRFTKKWGFGWHYSKRSHRLFIMARLPYMLFTFETQDNIRRVNHAQ